MQTFWGSMNGTLVRFNVKCTGLNANQDAGTQTKDVGQGRVNLKPCQLEYFTDTSLGLSISVNDIITYGANAFRTGLCCGFVYIEVPGFSYRNYVMGVSSFCEVKKGDTAYFRFNYTAQNFRSTYFIEDGP